MKTLYQEERRKKYLQELQDLSNRRHTDNFTSSQKSPIALNRYDDVDGPSPSPKPSLRTIARGLYNFQGQTARYVNIFRLGIQFSLSLSFSFILFHRELSFKKGDLILIRREVDKNWLEGELNGTYGLIPANYVEVKMSFFTN